MSIMISAAWNAGPLGRNMGSLRASPNRPQDLPEATQLLLCTNLFFE